MVPSLIWPVGKDVASCVLSMLAVATWAAVVSARFRTIPLKSSSWPCSWERSWLGGGGTFDCVTVLFLLWVHLGQCQAPAKLAGNPKQAPWNIAVHPSVSHSNNKPGCLQALHTSWGSTSVGSSTLPAWPKRLRCATWGRPPLPLRAPFGSPFRLALPRSFVAASANWRCACTKERKLTTLGASNHSLCCLFVVGVVRATPAGLHADALTKNTQDDCASRRTQCVILSVCVLGCMAFNVP